MMIAYPKADICFELKEDKVSTLIIENQHIFYSIISDIQEQLNGNNGELVLSECFQPLDVRRNIDMISQLVPFTINQKDLLNKLYAIIKTKAVYEISYQSTYETIAGISKYLYSLIEEQDMELTITVPEDISGLLKAFDLRFDDKDMSLPEKLLEYMIASDTLKGKRIFVTVNLRSYITDKQAEGLFRSVILRKINLVCIESSEHPRSESENVIIIDKDMCVI